MQVAKIKLKDFDMWINAEDEGLSRELVQRAKGLQAGLGLDDPGHEPASTWIMRDEVNHLMTKIKHPVFLDVGAHVGYFGRIMEHEANKYKKPYSLVLIEPDRESYIISKGNFEGNKNVAVIQGALVDKDAKIPFFQAEHRNMCSVFRNDRANVETEVLGFTLDSFCKTLGLQPNFIKVDIEGAEILMLQGARDFLVNSPTPLSMIIEIHPGKYVQLDLDFRSELKFLFENGFRCKYLISNEVYEPDCYKVAGLTPWKKFPPTVDFSRWHTIRRAIYKDVPADIAIELIELQYQGYALMVLTHAIVLEKEE